MRRGLYKTGGSKYGCSEKEITYQHTNSVPISYFGSSQVQISIPKLLFLWMFVVFPSLSVYLKAKWSRYRPGVAQRVGRGIALLFHDRGTTRGEGSAARPGRTLRPRKTRYPFYRRLGGPQSQSGRAENIVPTGIRSRNVFPFIYFIYILYI